MSNYFRLQWCDVLFIQLQLKREGFFFAFFPLLLLLLPPAGVIMNDYLSPLGP